MPSPIITPAGPLTRDGKTLTNFSSDQSVTWATSGGTLSNIAATSVTWEAPNKSGLWTLSGDNGPDPPTVVNITVQALLPPYWAWRQPVAAEKAALIFRPIYGPSQSRSFGDNSHIRNWELSNDDSSFENWQEIVAFHLWHFPGILFDMVDPVIPERRRYEIDSNLNFHYNHADSYAWSFRIKEAYPFALIGV
jgi:hypothetical protein